MATNTHGAGGLLETVRDVAPALSGNPLDVWHAARRGTEGVASALPDMAGIDHVKDFVRRYPVVATCVVLGAAYYLVGGRLFGMGRR